MQEVMYNEYAKEALEQLQKGIGVWWESGTFTTCVK